MKIKFNSDDDLPLNKPLKFHAMTIIIRSVFKEDGKPYPQLFLDDNLYDYKNATVRRNWCFRRNWRCKTSLSKECELCHYWFFKNIGFKFEKYVCNKYHDILMTAYTLKNIAILNLRGATFRCFLWGIIKDEGLRRINNSVLEDKDVL